MSFWARRSLGKNLGGLSLVLAIWIPVAHYADVATRPLIGDDIPWEKAPWYLLLLPTIMLVTRYVDRRPMEWAGIGLHQWTARELAQGAALGLGMTALVWLPFLLGGGTTIGSAGGPDYLLWTLYLLLSAAGEELLFRGYLFQRIVEITGPIVATLLLSSLFSAAHLANPSMSPLGALNIFLGGIFFSLCYLRTGSLWFPIAAHFVWNFVLAKVVGLTVSGMSMGGSLLATPDRLPVWLGGGEFGPEGGVIATAALLAGTAALLTIRSITYSPYVYAAGFWAARREALNPRAGTLSDPS